MSLLFINILYIDIDMYIDTDIEIDAIHCQYFMFTRVHCHRFNILYIHIYIVNVHLCSTMNKMFSRFHLHPCFRVYLLVHHSSLHTPGDTWLGQLDDASRKLQSNFPKQNNCNDIRYRNIKFTNSHNIRPTNTSRLAIASSSRAFNDSTSVNISTNSDLIVASMLANDVSNDKQQMTPFDQTLLFISSSIQSREVL